MTTTLAAQDLANEFTIIIREWLNEPTLKLIDFRNGTAEYREHGLCASHDFCDPNQAMIDALARFNVELDVQDEAQQKLIDDAWDIAKAQGFSSKIESV